MPALLARAAPSVGKAAIPGPGPGSLPAHPSAGKAVGPHVGEAHRRRAPHAPADRGDPGDPPGTRSSASTWRPTAFSARRSLHGTSSAPASYHISVSLDGADADTHEWVRGVKGCFEAAIGGIRESRCGRYPAPGHHDPHAKKCRSDRAARAPRRIPRRLVGQVQHRPAHGPGGEDARGRRDPVDPGDRETRGLGRK